MPYDSLVNSYLGTLRVDKERSRMELGGLEVAFHCDKFNTRILKNFEDVIGYEGGGELLFRMAEATTYEAMKAFLVDGAGAAEFGALDLRGRLEAACELFKVLAYGAIQVVDATPAKAVFTSKTSYLAEGWLENKSRWHLDEREGPACHDVRGHLAAILAIASGKPAGSYKVTETQCRAYKDAPLCEFIAEVK